MLNRYGHAGLVLGAIILAACVDSTGPQTESAAQLARHLDSLATQASLGPGTKNRYFMLLDLEDVAAGGAAPTLVTVTTRSGHQVWLGLMQRTALPVIYGYDSVYVVYAFSDYDVTNMLLAAVEYSHQQPTTVASILANDSVWAQGGSGTVAGATVTTGGACTQQPGTTVPGSQCVLARFSASVSWTFPAFAGIPSEFESITIKTQPFNGLDATGP